MNQKSLAKHKGRHLSSYNNSGKELNIALIKKAEKIGQTLAKQGQYNGSRDTV